MFSLLTRRLSAGVSLLKPSAIITVNSFNAGICCKTSNQFPCIRKCQKKKIKAAESKTLGPNSCDRMRMPRNTCNNFEGRDHNPKQNFKFNERVEHKASLWEYPADCCRNPCPQLQPRFDTLYYAPTDKANRQYQKTWMDFPPIKRRRRELCCYDPTTLPPIVRRKKSERPNTACEFDTEKLKSLCKAENNKKCLSIQSPCCIRGRYPPSCDKFKRSSNCRKLCCPYPSFSECSHPCPKPTKSGECVCTHPVPMCLVYKFLKRKLMYDLPPPLPAWPPKTADSH